MECTLNIPCSSASERAILACSSVAPWPGIPDLVTGMASHVSLSFWVSFWSAACTFLLFGLETCTDWLDLGDDCFWLDASPFRLRKFAIAWCFCGCASRASLRGLEHSVGGFSTDFPERLGGRIADGSFLTACSDHFVGEFREWALDSTCMKRNMDNASLFMQGFEYSFSIKASSVNANWYNRKCSRQWIHKNSTWLLSMWSLTISWPLYTFLCFFVPLWRAFSSLKETRSKILSVKARHKKRKGNA